LDSTIKKLTKESVENEIIITREQCCWKGNGNMAIETPQCPWLRFK
jgi:hypothetical protein